MKRKLPDIETLKELHFNKKMSCPKIARLYKCSECTVERTFRQHHIQLIDYRIKTPDIEILKDLYFNKKKSIEKIALEYKVSAASVRRAFRRNGIKSRSLSDAAALNKNIFNMTSDIIEFFYGLLLGDGCITLLKGAKGCRYTHADKNMSYIRWLRRVLSGFGIKAGSIYLRKITNCNTKRERFSWNINSMSYDAYSKIRKEWYPNGKKSIPNIKIKPIVIFNYFIGDGSVVWRKGKVSSLLICENDPEKIKIVKQLDNIGIYCSVRKTGIYIKAKGREKFFQYICEIPYFIPKCYYYKFPKEFIFYNKMWALMEKYKSLSLNKPE